MYTLIIKIVASQRVNYAVISMARAKKSQNAAWEPSDKKSTDDRILRRSNRPPLYSLAS